MSLEEGCRGRWVTHPVPLHPLPASPFKPASDSVSKTHAQEGLVCFQENLDS